MPSHKTLLLIASTLLLSACSSQLWFDIGRQQQLSQCNKEIDYRDFAACKERTERYSYQDYRKEQQRITQEPDDTKFHVKQP